jgi:hypothetical protein
LCTLDAFGNLRNKAHNNQEILKNELPASSLTRQEALQADYPGNPNTTNEFSNLNVTLSAFPTIQETFSFMTDSSDECEDDNIEEDQPASDTNEETVSSDSDEVVFAISLS